MANVMRRACARARWTGAFVVAGAMGCGSNGGSGMGTGAASTSTSSTGGAASTSSTGDTTSTSSTASTSSTTGMGGTTSAPSCTDGKKDGSETDVDCGGSMCPPCPNDLHCKAGTDCVDGYCPPDLLVCTKPTCNDGARDGYETDVDCGGGSFLGAPACPKCADGLSCKTGGDCIDKICSPQMTCQAPACTDMVQNGNETDVDCGGGSYMGAPACPACAVGKKCQVGADCTAGGSPTDGGVCDTGVCRVAHSCKELLAGNAALKLKDGVYTIDWNGTQMPGPAYCDMTTDGGGWTALTNPAMPASLPKTAPTVQASFALLGGSSSCQANTIQQGTYNGFYGFDRYDCGNVNFSMTIKWQNTIGAGDVMFAAQLQQPSAPPGPASCAGAPVLTLNTKGVTSYASNVSSVPTDQPMCFFWNSASSSFSQESAMNGCTGSSWCANTILAAPPHIVHGALDFPSAGSNLSLVATVGPPCPVNNDYCVGTNVEVSQLYVR